MDPATIDYRQLAVAAIQAAGAGANASMKAVSGTPTATYGHGPGGTFSPAGLARPVINAMMLPYLGLQAALPFRPSNEVSPLYGIVTGQTAGSGSEPSTACGDFPTAGLLELCTHTFTFGRRGRMTQVIDITRVGKINNRGEFYDFQLLGDPINGGTGLSAFNQGTGSANNPLVPTMPGGLDANNALNNEIMKQVFQLAVEMARVFAKDFYTGNPANNVGAGTTYYKGLDLLINTGYVDAVTNTACPAADSLIVNWQNQRVDAAGGSLVRTITAIYRDLVIRAEQMGLAPASWAIAMRPNLFYEITEVWPCAYNSYRCNLTGTSSTQYVSVQDQINMRDDMRRGKYLLIDGERVPVVVDSAITEDSIGPGVPAGSAVFRSQIYFVPLKVLGGTPVTYMEYFNYDQGGPIGSTMDAARAFAPDGAFMTTDGGRFLWHKKPPTNYCVQMQIISENRLVLLTPQLAARLINVQYSPLIHEREWDPSSPYFAAGGVTTYSAPTYYS